MRHLLPGLASFAFALAAIAADTPTTATERPPAERPPTERPPAKSVPAERAPAERPAAQPPARPGPQVITRVGGTAQLRLLEVKEGSVTVKSASPVDMGEARQTLPTDPDRTRVFFVEAKWQEQTERGTSRTLVKRRRGTLAELKPGQRVLIWERDGVATAIQVELPTPDEARQQSPDEPKQREKDDPKQSEKN